MLEPPSWFSDGVGCSVERAADALNRTGIYPQTGPQSCAPPLCALAGSEPHGFGVPARVLWATSRAILPRLGPRSATPSSTRPLFVPASLTEPKATEFPPLPDGALGSLAGAVLPVFLTLRPLESAGSCSGARSKAIADSMSAPARQPSAAVALTRSHKRRNHVLAEERDGVGAVNGRERAAGLVGFGPSRMTVTEGIKWSSISRRMSISHCSAKSAPFLASVRSASRRRTLGSAETIGESDGRVPLWPALRRGERVPLWRALWPPYRSTEARPAGGDPYRGAPACPACGL